MIELRNAPWELVDSNHLDPLAQCQADAWSELYRYPVWAGVPAGETVTDGWSQPHTAPAAAGTYTLLQYVQNGHLVRHEWRKEQ